MEQFQRCFNLCFLVVPTLTFFVSGGCHKGHPGTETGTSQDDPVGISLTTARTQDGKYISWREHIIDDTEKAGFELSGSDGLVMADLDNDGYEDVISVHESDTQYDGIAKGHVRVAYGSENPFDWQLQTLVEGPNAGAAEDVAVADLNGDGFLDVIVACELAHLIYLENPGKNKRTSKWNSKIPNITQGKGSYIRVFAADINGDGMAEVIAANKGQQSTRQPENHEPRSISYFSIEGNPLDDDAWVENLLVSVKVPINCSPVDIDGDGDIDIIAGSRGEKRILLLENTGDSKLPFLVHDIHPAFDEDELPIVFDSSNRLSGITGFNMDFVDLNNDGRLDITLTESFQHLIWLEQPGAWSDPWKVHWVGTFDPDQLVGILSCDINGDGFNDIMAGAYSRGPRDQDGVVSLNDPLGRLAWFENPKDLSLPWLRHDISRRKRGMFDKFEARDIDNDGDFDFVATRGNSLPYDGVFWLEQVRSARPIQSFVQARNSESEEVGLPDD